jgi:selenide,water dikinase
VTGTALRRYRPQSAYLILLNLGDGSALGTRWGHAVVGRRVFVWKDHIDRRFVRRFQTQAS